MIYPIRLNPVVLVKGVALFGLCLISYWIIPFLHGLFFSPTKNIPGPLLARLTRWYEYFAVRRGQSNIEYIKLHEKFGTWINDMNAS